MITQEEIKKLAKALERDDKEFIPDPWQKKVIAHQGDIALRTGRQVGKSVTIARKCANLGVEYNNITILMVAAAQRQSSEIFQKTLKHLYKLNDALIEKAGEEILAEELAEEIYKSGLEGKKPNLNFDINRLKGFVPKKHMSAKQNMEDQRKFGAEHGLFVGNITRTECNLKNGTRILSLPTGKSGTFVRCYTVDILIGDEAAFIPEPVWLAIKPMLATSKKMRGLGWTILLSTPFGKGGYYYDCCFDPDFLNIHVSSEDCRRIGVEFLRKEKKRLTKKEYAQEYIGMFVADFNQFFKTTLIKHCMNFIEWNFIKEYQKEKKYYLGVDIARYGMDENAFVIAELSSNNKIKIVHVETTEKKSIPDTVGRVLALHQKFNFKRIFTDDSGLGAGVTDLLIERLGKSRVEGINNAFRTIQDDRHKGILKEDLYSNALSLMEQSKCDIIASLPLQRSLINTTFEYTSYANLRIYGKKSHLTEAFVRACWCVKSKGLNLFLA